MHVKFCTQGVNKHSNTAIYVLLVTFVIRGWVVGVWASLCESEESHTDWLSEVYAVKLGDCDDIFCPQNGTCICENGSS